MLEADRRGTRHRQVETIKRSADIQSSRGLYVPGLRACRMAAMLTQRELADLAQTYQSTVHELESLGRPASLTMLRRLCHAMDVGPEDLCSASSSDKK